MAGFTHLGNIVEKMENGNIHYSSFRKTPSVVTVAGMWFDMSMSPGNPVPQYYAAAPLLATQMKRSTDGGLNHGAQVTPSSKFLKRTLIMSSSATGLPLSYTMCDYLLYYPFIDTGTNDEQALTNSVTLPRYADGKGVQVMAVSVAPCSGTGGPDFYINYTNSAGVTGRISKTHKLNTGTVNGTILSSVAGTVISSSPFLGLQDGDTGVRSIESVTFPATTDVGLLALVLVKPLYTSVLCEQTAPCEVDLLAQQSNLPVIYDDAYLNFICLPQGSLSGVGFFGEIETIWT